MAPRRWAGDLPERVAKLDESWRRTGRRRRGYTRLRTVGVAQLVELLVVVQAVGGSSPLAHPSESPAERGFLRFRGRSTGAGSPQIPPPTCRMPGTAAEPGKARSAIGARNLRGRPEPADRGRPAAASSRSSARSGDSPDSHSVPEPANPRAASLRGAISAFWNPCLGNRAVGTVIGTRSAARFNWRPSRPAIVRLVARPCATSTGTPMNHEDSPKRREHSLRRTLAPDGHEPSWCPESDLEPSPHASAPSLDTRPIRRRPLSCAIGGRTRVDRETDCLVFAGVPAARLGDLYRRGDNQPPGSWRAETPGSLRTFVVGSSS